EKWRDKNRHIIRAGELKRRRNNPEKYRLKKKEQEHRRRLRDPAWRVKCNLRRRIMSALGRHTKSDKTISLLGCSAESFRIYLESKFEPGMSWENYGKKVGDWNVDHIVPLALFDLSKSEHQRIAFHFSNCQPMWFV